jgi:hypothetical protein
MLGFRLRCKLAIKGLELILVVEHYRMWIFRCRDKHLHKKSVAEEHLLSLRMWRLSPRKVDRNYQLTCNVYHRD